MIALQSRQNVTLSAPPRPVAAFVSWTFLLALAGSTPVVLTAYRKLFVKRRCSHMASIYYYSTYLSRDSAGLIANSAGGCAAPQSGSKIAKWGQTLRYPTNLLVT